MSKQFIVTKKAQRPARMNGHCFYCDQPIGAEHKADCVLVNRNVKIKIIYEIETDVPAQWAKEDIERHYNEGTWCADNAHNMIRKHAHRLDLDCACPLVKVKYVKHTSEPFLDE